MIRVGQKTCDHSRHPRRRRMIARLYDSCYFQSLQFVSPPSNPFELLAAPNQKGNARNQEENNGLKTLCLCLLFPFSFPLYMVCPF